MKTFHFVIVLVNNNNTTPFTTKLHNTTKPFFYPADGQVILVHV